MRVHSFNNVPSQVRTLVAADVPGLVRGDFGDFRRFCSILGEFNVGTIPKHTSFPGSWVGTEHDLKSALVHCKALLQGDYASDLCGDEQRGEQPRAG